MTEPVRRPTSSNTDRPPLTRWISCAAGSHPTQRTTRDPPCPGQKRQRTTGTRGPSKSRLKRRYSARSHCLRQERTFSRGQRNTAPAPRHRCTSVAVAAGRSWTHQSLPGRPRQFVKGVRNKWSAGDRLRDRGPRPEGCRERCVAFTPHRCRRPTPGRGLRLGDSRPAPGRPFLGGCNCLGFVKIFGSAGRHGFRPQVRRLHSSGGCSCCMLPGQLALRRVVLLVRSR
jgi:hypothetical protein